MNSKSLRERAEKILQELGGFSREANKKYLLAELEKVRASAFEEAARIAEIWPSDGGFVAVHDPKDPIDCMISLRKGIANSIRAKAKEMGK